MPNVLSPLLRPIGLDPSQGYDTAAAGAKAAQGQANQLSDLQWNRQMQGLQQAQGYTGQLQDLYNSIYSPGGGRPAAGGMPMGGGMAGMMPPGNSMLLGPPKPPPPVAGNSGGLDTAIGTVGGGVLGGVLTGGNPLGIAGGAWLGNKATPYVEDAAKGLYNTGKSAINTLTSLF